MKKRPKLKNRKRFKDPHERAAFYFVWGHHLIAKARRLVSAEGLDLAIVEEYRRELDHD